MDTKNNQLTKVMELFTTLLSERQSQEQLEPISPSVPPERLLDELPLGLPEMGLPFDEVADRLRAVIKATPSTAPERFYNQLFGGREPFAVLGDVLATALNNSMYTYKVAGPQVLLENELIERMGKMMGYENHEGSFTPGGSISNLCAMLLARDQAFPDFREQWHGRLSPADLHVGGSPLFCAQSSRHPRRGACRTWCVFPHGRSADGCLLPPLPWPSTRTLMPAMCRLMVNATAGTTVQGAFDPISELADVCEPRNIWLHLDGAFGAIDDLRRALRGNLRGFSERVDSITWDAHKLMGVPLTCSVLLVRERGHPEGQLRRGRWLPVSKRR